MNLCTSINRSITFLKRKHKVPTLKKWTNWHSLESDEKVTIEMTYLKKVTEKWQIKSPSFKKWQCDTRGGPILLRPPCSLIPSPSTSCTSYKILLYLMHGLAKARECLGRNKTRNCKMNATASFSTKMRNNHTDYRIRLIGFISNGCKCC
jgi:hypothetical protein